MPRAIIGLLMVSGILSAASLASVPTQERSRMPSICLAADGTGFVEEGSGRRFAPWGFNYDHDRQGRLIEDYWGAEWKTVEEDFGEMRQLGANVVRVHLQFGRFMPQPGKLDGTQVARLRDLLQLAERTGLYLDITGLGCYHKADVPEWYDRLDEAGRWRAQAEFWRSIARVCQDSPAVFCYDLMNEPVVPGGRRQPKDWLGPPFGDKHFVQFITLDQRDRPRPDIARLWVDTLVQAIREVDKRHLITVGLVPWSLDRPGLTSGFVPQKVAPALDFVAVHLYPEQGKLDEALDTLRGFFVGKPVVVEEVFPLRCSVQELEQFMDRADPLVAGWIGFYWGKTREECRQGKTLADALMAEWLELFARRGKSRK